MIVKVDSFALDDKKGYIKYKVSDMTMEYLEFFNNNLDEETEIIYCAVDNNSNTDNNVDECNNYDYMIITAYFNKEYFPFQSKTAEYRLNDFIAREEIEMAAFLTEFLEDFK
ncbi:MAG: DUF5750 family protein [Methanobacteriaceae archaeon]